MMNSLVLARAWGRLGLLGGSRAGIALAALMAIAMGSAASAQSLTTTFVSSNGGSPNWTVYYDLTVNSSLNIQSFDVNVSATAGTAFTVDVYTTDVGGTYVGNTRNAALWTLKGTGAGVSAGTDQPSNVDPPDFTLTPGTYGVALRISVSQKYTDGNGSNQTYSNADMTISCGAVEVTDTAPFVSTLLFSPRVWNGTIYYAPANPAAVGACCFTNGTCEFLSVASCSSMTGNFRGENLACASVACPEPGACCNTASGVCTATSTGAAGCAAGTTYQGAGSSCQPTNPCPQPPPPANDNCSTATELSGPGVFGVTNLFAAAPTDNSPITCPATASAMNNDVWFKWTATADGMIAISARAFPAAFTGRYAIYDGGAAPGSCPTGGAGLIGCNAFAATTVTATVPNAAVVAGNVYYFQFASQTAGTTGSATVDFDFTPTQTGSCCAGGGCTVQTAGECAATGGTYTAGAFCSGPTGMTSTYAGGAGAIPSGTTGTVEGVFQDSVVVSDTFPIEDVEVDINMTHTFQGDLIFSLSNGVRTLVLDNRGRRGAASAGATGSDFNGLYTFSDSGAQSIFDYVVTGSVTPIPSGTYHAGGVLGLTRGLKSTFNGMPANGTWTLRIVDHQSGDTGNVSSWTLRLKQGTASSCAAAGVCCRGATCNSTVTDAGACTASLVPGQKAGAAFVTSSSTCNSGPVSNTPCCYANYNKTNGINVQDIFDFLSDWFAGGSYARVGSNGAPGPLAVQNIFDFLSDWFTGGCS